ncbi:MAG: porin family protein [Prevotella sp.]|nr:porin family protein [Prevotella sp.]
MKKILMTLVAVAMATTMNAQWYVGGSVGFGSVKVAGGSSESTYKVIPEVGYNINDNWAVGVALGYQKGTCSFGNSLLDFTNFNTAEVFAVSPYARYTFVNSDLVNVFIDGALDFGSIKDAGTTFQVGLRPGIALKASDKISLVAHIGFVGFNTFSPKGDGKSSNAFGLSLDNSTASFGVYYNF